MSEVHMRCDGQLQFSILDGWAMRNMGIDFGIEGMETNFQGLESNEDLFNEVMSAVGAEILNENWPVMEPLIVAQIEEVNKFLPVNYSLYLTRIKLMRYLCGFTDYVAIFE